MHHLDDPNYLRTSQYRDSRNLNQRVGLHARFSTNPQSWFSWLATRFDFPLSSRLLEVGCGPGLLWRAHPECLPVFAVLSDFSPGMVAEARQSIQPERPDIQFSIFDATSLPFPDQSFDVVVANHMLYHVPDRRQALADIRRVLRPGGRLFAATNGKGHLAELYSWVAQAASLSPSETPPLWKSVTVAFNLENGAGQLSEHFNHVESLQYPNSLAVTEAAPLMDYVRSMMGDIPTILARSDVLSRLNALWQAELDQTDVIRISISTGLFIAY